MRPPPKWLVVVALAACGSGSPPSLCRDRGVADTLGGEPGCRAYLEACVDGLSDHQRAHWRSAVDACFSGTAPILACYRQVPWC